MAVSFIVWGIVWGPWAFMAMRESIDHATLRHDVAKAQVANIFNGLQSDAQARPDPVLS
jgi:hypothetical protein